MSAHRLHTLDMAHPAQRTPTPAEPAKRPLPPGRFLAGGLLTLMFALLALHAAVALTQPEVTVQPVRTPQSVVTEAPPLTAQERAQARLEGYRAGLAAGAEQGCAAPRLSYPLGLK